MLLGTMSGKIPQGKCEEANCMHVSSSRDFSNPPGGVKVGEKNETVLGEGVWLLSPKPPSCSLSWRPGRVSTVLLWLPAGEELQSSQAPLENSVANVSQSLMDIPKEEGRGREGALWTQLIFLLNKWPAAFPHLPPRTWDWMHLDQPSSLNAPWGKGQAGDLQVSVTRSLYQHWNLRLWSLLRWNLNTAVLSVHEC